VHESGELAEQRVEHRFTERRAMVGVCAFSVHDEDATPAELS
jgi:hypothetical protein